MVEISAGIFDGDSVIVRGHYTLAQDSKIVTKNYCRGGRLDK